MTPQQQYEALIKDKDARNWTPYVHKGKQSTQGAWLIDPKKYENTSQPLVSLFNRNQTEQYMKEQGWVKFTPKAPAKTTTKKTAK